MYVLNNVTTGDKYTPANTLECPGSEYQVVIVTGTSIYYQTKERQAGYVSQAAPTESEAFLPPGYYTWQRPLEQIEVRSAVTGKPAQVTIHA